MLYFLDKETPYFEICRDHFDELVQERRNPISNALELRLSSTNPSIYCYFLLPISVIGGIILVHIL